MRENQSKSTLERRKMNQNRCVDCGCDITERSFVITGDTLNIIRDFFKIGKINAKDMIKSNDIEKWLHKVMKKSNS